MADEIKIILSVILASVIALFVVKFRITDLSKKLYKAIGKETGSASIWQDFFDLNRGSHLRCYGKYNYRASMISGDVVNYEVCEDGECNVIINKVEVQYLDNKKVYKTNPDQLFHLNTRYVHGLEVSLGEPPTQRARRKKAKPEEGTQIETESSSYTINYSHI